MLTFTKADKDEQPLDSSSTIHDAYYLQRKTLSGRFSFSSLFKPVTIQEPVYKEVVVLFKKRPEAGEQDSNGIFIQR